MKELTLSEKRAIAGAKGGAIGGKIGGKISKGGGRPVTWTEERINKLKKMCKSMTQRQAAKELGIDESRVSRLINR